MRLAGQKWNLAAAAVILIVLAALAASTSSAQAAKPAPRSYRLIDAGTLGGPQSFINFPGLPITRNGALIGTADTGVADSDYPNFNPFVIGLPDPFTAHAFSYRNGRMTDLGALPGNNSSDVFQVNSNGVGAGLSETGTIDPLTGWPAQHAVIFKHGRVTDLGTLPGGDESLAVSIDDRGQVAGFGNNGTEDPYPTVFFGDDNWVTETRSFAWQNGVLRDIGTLGGPDALMTTMNARGQITGNSFTSSTPNDTTGIPTLDPFIWEKGRMRDLGSLGGTIGFANWMNNAGQVAGFSTFAGDESGHAFLWNGMRMRDLGTFGGEFSFANYVNDAGHVTGVASLTDGTAHGFIWANGKLRDLPPLDGAPCSVGFAINNRDDVVGAADDCEGNQLAPVLWHKGVPYDLSTLIAPTQLTLGEFEYINDRGEIVGRATLPSGDVHEVMLVPASRGWSAALATVKPQSLAASARANRPSSASHHDFAVTPNGLQATYGGGGIDGLLAKIAFGRSARHS